MLKLLGAFLILSAAAIYGYQLKQRLAEHLKQLIGLKEMLMMLSGEISYARTPLREAFCHIAEQGKEPYGTLLKSVAEEMGEECDWSLFQIWTGALKQQRKQFLLTEEEFSILTALGENFGYLDAKMQLGNIELSKQQVEVKIVQAQQELAVKQKMYQYLSVMCGLFLILILI